ncbi:FYVE [Phytophthora citrophthora]|uniref:FYVE n=1 Tax=Phytophthora citrophthora TaxID=4793 RepID=A0AAD9GQN2_9STRA|nr:FYVE [Phytophthora citrophthora]
MVRSLPLRSGFFKAPELSDADQTELLAWGRSLVPDLVRQPEVEWTMIHERKGVQLCEDRQKGGLTYSIRAVATVRASLDDVMDIFLAQNTVDYRSLMQLQLREFFADAAVLFHKEQNESEALSIKWTAARTKKSVSLGGQVGVDFCFLEYAGVISAEQVDGRALNGSSSSGKAAPVGVCLYESIDQAECPSLYDSHKLERASVSKCGFIFRPVEEGVVEATFVCSIRQPPGARSKRRWNRALLAHWAESVAGIEEAISRRRISKELTKRRVPTWVNDKDRACCHLCLKTFTNTRRKHHCRACGEIICRACSVYKSVDLQSVGLTTLRVCKACMDGTSTTAADREKEEENLKAVAAVAVVANGATADGVALPEGVDNSVLRDAVEEYALALPGAQVSTVPDLVGIAWLQQLATRDQESKAMVNALMERLRIDSQQKDANGTIEEQVDIYDTLCDLAAQTLACKYAVVSLVDENRQWFKSAVNVKESEVPRDFSFCEYPVRDQRPLVVMDTLRDPRFKTNPFVTGPLGVRFLAGAPLFTVDNECVGAVCVLDTAPRESLQESQIATMQNLAHLAMVMVQERREAQSKVARAMASSQLVPARQNGGPISNNAGSSDLVPLSSYSETSMVVQGRERPKEDPVLKEQMIQLLHKASQVRDQVNQQTHKQQAGLQSSAE